MSYRVRFTKEAKEDIERLYSFPLDKDLLVARRAKSTIKKGIEFLKDFPFSCRKATSENPFLREMLISFDNSGYVVLFEIEDNEIVTILAIRHQLESDYH